jgi:hypothetical protein
MELTIVHTDVNQLVTNIASDSPDDQAMIYLNFSPGIQTTAPDSRCMDARNRQTNIRANDSSYTDLIHRA